MSLYERYANLFRVIFSFLYWDKGVWEAMDVSIFCFALCFVAFFYKEIIVLKNNG
jgi:hypothetical protein